MTSFLTVFAIAFVAILLVELPDKTLVATLVLSTKYRPRPVLVGVAAAFAVQCAIAVTAGGLLHLLNKRLVEAIVAVLFALGSILLIRESLDGDDEDAADDGAPVGVVSTRRIIGISFGVLFAAEWGDASQLATAGLVAKYGSPVAIGLGAFLALVAVATLAASVGKAILRVVPLTLVHRVAAALFAVFAVIAAIAAARG
jgi:putative Ca2+/H+ antiporter (TMEM165/GDT1 family)